MADDLDLAIGVIERYLDLLRTITPDEARALRSVAEAAEVEGFAITRGSRNGPPPPGAALESVIGGTANILTGDPAAQMAQMSATLDWLKAHKPGPWPP